MRSADSSSSVLGDITFSTIVCDPRGDCEVFGEWELSSPLRLGDVGLFGTGDVELFGVGDLDSDFILVLSLSFELVFSSFSSVVSSVLSPVL